MGTDQHGGAEFRGTPGRVPNVTILEHRRCQFAVGEGSFHAGSVAIGDDSPLSYVYDCGAQPKYRRALEREIDRLKAVLAAGHGSGHLEFVFLSHAHIDHVNGAEQLAQNTSIGTVVLPLLEPAERLIAFAHAEHHAGLKAADRDFYRRFLPLTP